MKSILLRALRVLAVVALVVGVLVGGFFTYFGINNEQLEQRLTAQAPRLSVQGLTFRDLNKNGRLDPYEDRRQPVQARVENLLAQMTLAEKAGQMMSPIVGMNADGSVGWFPGPSGPNVLKDKLLRQHITTYYFAFPVNDAGATARWANRVQQLAERTRLGIPVSLASDNRNVKDYGTPVVYIEKGQHSAWCDLLGLAATRDTALAYEFGRAVAQEYRAVGFTISYFTIDLATEPRWSRFGASLGEDADVASRLAKAYIRGCQGDSVGASSVLCQVNHFPGNGPTENGYDPHFQFGKNLIYPGSNLAYHLKPFQAAIAAGAAQMMPAYGIPVGQTAKPLAVAYNKEITTDLMRKRMGFNGVICTDYYTITSFAVGPLVFVENKSWGVEKLSAKERVKVAIDAGNDQLGGESVPELIVELVNEGKLSESRINESVRRILLDKFRVGLFDNPYVDEARAGQLVGNAELVRKGRLAQQKALVLLSNPRKLLPLQKGIKLYTEGFDPLEVARFGTVADELDDADVAIIRLRTPFEVKRSDFMSGYFHHGDLDFKGAEKERILRILKAKPTIVCLYPDRPTVMPEIVQQAAAVMADFSCEDPVLLATLFGQARPTGKLPFEMPSSMAAVRQQKADVPGDSPNPLFRLGHGLSY